MKLGGDGAEVLPPVWGLYLQQLLHRQTIGLVVNHRGHIVQPVGQGDNLDVSAFLRQLFRPSVQVAEDRFDLQNLLAVKGDSQPEHPVSAGVLWTDVHGHGLSANGHTYSEGPMPGLGIEGERR